MLSEEFRDSPECAKEVDVAAAAHKRVISVAWRLDAPDGLHPEVTAHEWIRPAGDTAAIARQVLEAMRTDFAWLDRHAELLDRAQQWDGKRGGVLRGKELEEAERWLADQGDHRRPPTQRQREFILASHDAAKQRQRTGLALALSVAAALGVLAVIALLLRASSDRNATLAHAREVASEASLTSASQPDLSLLLGVRAARMHAAPEAQTALISTLLANPGLDGFLHGRRRPAAAVAFPDGTHLATVYLSGAVDVWDLRSGRVSHPPGIGALFGATTSGPWVAALRKDMTVDVYDLSTRRPVHVLDTGPLDRHRPRVESLAFDPSARLLAAAGDRGPVKVWRLDQPGARAIAAPRAFVRRLGSPPAIALAPDDLLVGATGRRQRSGPVKGPQPLKLELWRLGGRRIRTLVLAPDSANPAEGVAADFGAYALRTFNELFVADRRLGHGAGFKTSIGLVDTVKLPAPIDVLAMEGDTPVYVLESGGVGIASTSSLTGTQALLSPDSRLVEPLVTAFGVSPAVAALAGPDGTIAVLRMASGDGSPPPAFALPLASSDADGDTVSVTPSGTLAFSADGRRLVASDYEGIGVWNTRTGAAEADLAARDVASAGISPDGALVAFVSGTAVHLWQPGETASRTLPIPDAQLVAFDPRHPGVLLVDTAAGRVVSWDLPARRVLASRRIPVVPGLGDLVAAAPLLPVSGPSGRRLAVSADGRVAALTNASSQIEVWDVRRRRSRGALPWRPRNTSDAPAASLSHDGALLAVASRGSVTLWDTATLREVGALATGNDFDSPFQVAFGPTDDLVVTGPGLAELLDLKAGDLTRLACRIAGRDLTRQEWAQYVGGGYEPTCASAAARSAPALDPP